MVSKDKKSQIPKESKVEHQSKMGALESLCVAKGSLAWR